MSDVSIQHVDLWKVVTQLLKQLCRTAQSKTERTIRKKDFIEGKSVGSPKWAV